MPVGPQVHCIKSITDPLTGSGTWFCWQDGPHSVPPSNCPGGGPWKGSWTCGSAKCPTDGGGGNDTIGNDTIPCDPQTKPKCSAGQEAVCCDGVWICLPKGEECPCKDGKRCGGKCKPLDLPDKGKEWKCCKDKWVQVDEGKDCPEDDCGPKKVCCDADKAIDLSDCLGKPDKGVHRWISVLPWGKKKSDEAWVDSECGDRELSEYFADFEPVSKLKEWIPSDAKRDTYAMEVWNTADPSDPDEDNKWIVDCSTLNSDPPKPACLKD